MPRRSWPPQLVPEGSEKKNTIRRMIRKKSVEEEEGLEFDSHQQHAASWATLPHPTPS